MMKMTRLSSWRWNESGYLLQQTTELPFYLYSDILLILLTFLKIDCFIILLSLTFLASIKHFPTPNK